MNYFTDLSVLPEQVQCAYLLFPLLGLHAAYPMDKHDVHKYRFDQFLDYGNAFLKFSKRTIADIFVLPFHWEETRYHPELKDIAQELVCDWDKDSKAIVVFYIQDDDIPIQLTGENLIVCRTSLNRSTKQENERVFPAICDDLIRHYHQGEIPFRSKTDKPVVGFCGTAHTYVANTMKKKIKFLLGQNSITNSLFTRLGFSLIHHAGAKTRLQTLNAIKRSRKITPNLILRDQFWNGTLRKRGEFQADKLTASRLEFVQNIIGSDYILCPRGTGNYSYRLYEALCCGRIPVVIDTDMELPFARHIPWKKISVLVGESEIHKISERILEFHKNLSASDYHEVQQLCRSIWVEWFSAQGVFSHMKELIDG